MVQLTVSKRLRSTPFSSRVERLGVKSYTVYNHMLLATGFRSLEADYWHLCENVQIWDVSCERQVQIKGPDATRLVQWMTPRDVSKAQSDQCFYLPLCDQNGKMINDPIAIRIDADTWWLSIADSDVALWAKGLALGKGLEVEITEAGVWPIAIQGPKADDLMARVFGDQVRQIRFFRYQRLSYRGHEFIIARSGWSKQGGFEVYVDDAELGCQLWDELFKLGKDLNVGPGGPNNIERIESGLLSYGNDINSQHSPLQCGLGRYCHLDRDLDSMSVAALAAEKAAGIKSQLMGLFAPGLNQLGTGFEVHAGDQIVGEITSQCLSARYDTWLGFAMLDTHAIHQALTITIDHAAVPIKATPLPFDWAALKLTPQPR